MNESYGCCIRIGSGFTIFPSLTSWPQAGWRSASEAPYNHPLFSILFSSFLCFPHAFSVLSMPKEVFVNHISLLYSGHIMDDEYANEIL